MFLNQLKSLTMKKLSVILFIVLFSVPAFSQFINFGFKAGAESNTVPAYNISSGEFNIEAMKNASWGFHGGIFTRINIQTLYIQPEVVFTSNSFDYEVVNFPPPYSSSRPPSSYSVIKSQKFNRLSIPVLVGMKFGPLRINAGPAADIQIGTPKALIDDPKFKDMYKEAVWGFQAGIGVDILKAFTFDVRYAGSLGEKYGKSITIGNQDYKLNQGQKSFLVSIGIMF